jgi:hypothetical protein
LKNYILRILLALLVITLYSCNEQPTNIGYSLLYDTIDVFTISNAEKQIIAETENFLLQAQIANNGALFLGVGNGIKANAILRFGSFPDSIIDAIDYEPFEAKIYMSPSRYTFGDSLTNSFAFTAHKVNQFWNIKSTWDSIFKPDGTSDIIDARALGSFDGDIIQLDSMLDIDFDLELDLIKEWMQNQRDSITNWGIALIASPKTSLIRKFYAQQVSKEYSNAKLKVLFRGKNNPSDTLELLLSAAVESSFIHSPPTPKEDIVLQGGTSSRCYFTFDFSSLPQNAGIHKATLELRLDPSRCTVGNNGVDSIITAHIYDPNIEEMDEPLAAYYAERVKGTNIFKFEALASAIEYWNRISGKMRFVVLPEGNDLYRELDRLTFYGLNNPDSSLIPKLRIIYSTRPNYKD